MTTYASISTALKAYFGLTAKETMDYYKGCPPEERAEWVEMFKAVDIQITPKA